MKQLSGVWIFAAAAGLGLIAAGTKPVHAAGAFPASGAPASGAYMQDRDRDRDWEAPPPELDEVSRRGFHEGVEGARADYNNHRRPDVNNREEYRHPHVPERDREAYRHGFERGYQAGVDHLYHGRV